MTLPPTKEITVVLGSGRSGTSVVTKALQTLGCYLGENLVPAAPMNPKGFFEDDEIMNGINEKIIGRLGRNWYDVSVFNLFLPSVSLDDLSAKAEEILEKKFMVSSWCGFKDIRVCRLLPFWQPLFKKMSLKESYILALRNPLSSVASFEQHCSIHPSKGFLLWVMHIVPAIENTLTKDLLIINYEEMLSNPTKQLERIHNKLKISKALDATALAEYSEDFLDVALSRNQYSYEEFKSNPETPPICIKLYDLLNLVALDKLKIDSSEFKKQWVEILKEYSILLNNISPVFRLLDKTMDEAVGQRLSVQEQKISAQEQKISVQEQKISAQEQKISVQEQKISAQEQKISAQEQRINALLLSSSWRLTAPIRKISYYINIRLNLFKKIFLRKTCGEKV